MKRILRIVVAVFAVLLLVAAALVFWQTRSPSFEPFASSTLPAAGRDAGGAIRAQFFGTATILIGDGESSVLVDGFFSRPPLTTVLFGEIAPDEARIDRALSSGQVKKVDA